MSEPAHVVRLNILLSDGLSGVSRVIDRLAVIGIVPEWILFKARPNDRAYVHLALDPSARPQAEALAVRLAQMVQVGCLRLSSTPAIQASAEPRVHPSGAVLSWP